MANPGTDRPLRKVTINLYEDDCAKLEADFGHGWSRVVRDWVHDHCKLTRTEITTYHRLKRTLGDLE